MPKPQPIKLKNILAGVLIGLLIIFVIVSIFYYFKVYLPSQETKRIIKHLERIETEYLEWLKQQKEKELEIP